MKELKPFLISLLVVTSLFLGITAYAAPNGRYEFNLWPVTDNRYELGTTTLRWFRFFSSYASTTQLSADSLCLNSDTCRTTWPTGGSGTFSWTPTSWGVSTSTTLGFLQGFLSTASSTIDSTLRLTGNLFFDGELLPDGATCSNGQILKRTGANDWDCAADDTSAGGGTFAWTPTSYGVSTSTTLGFLQGFLSTASSTINASSTITGVLTASGGIFGNLTGTASLATALGANGANCSSGNSPLGVDASGAVESCFDVWTEAENTSAGYTTNTGTVTSIATTFPILGGPITTTGTLTFGGLSTSTNPTIGQLPYWTGVNTFGSVATGTISVPTGLTITANRSAVGGAAVIGLDTGYVIPLQSTLDA